MKGDFSRDTFDVSKHFSRVLMQQGRVQLDADWNEQTSILLHYLRTLAADLIGPHGAPYDPKPNETNFAIKASPNGKTFTIAPGHYYVNGILCENDCKNEHGTLAPRPYESQKDYPNPLILDLSTAGTWLVYLDVWERHVTWVEDWQESEPGIREVALGGPDTATRAKVVWQVKVAPKADEITAAIIKEKEPEAFCTYLGDLESPISPGTGALSARAKSGSSQDFDQCSVSPEARYHGTENQLYRVEIHTPGAAGTATFKWSRDNGSVIFPVREINGTEIKLDSLGRDDRSTLHEGDWVELVDDHQVLKGSPGTLAQVDRVNRDEMSVTVKASKDFAPHFNKDEYRSRHVLLRRWDYRDREWPTFKLTSTQTSAPASDGALEVVEGTEDGGWLPLENGIEVQFQPKGNYRTGDYWLIPARTETGDVEWPGTREEPEARPPHGVRHHYAPLAILTVNAIGIVTVADTNDCRRKINGQ